MDETTKLYSRYSPRTSSPPLINLQYLSLFNTATDESIGTAETPASSIYIDLFDKLDPRLLKE